MDKIKFTIIEEKHINYISNIHNTELGESVLNLFGIKFLEAMYLDLLKQGNWGFLAQINGEVIGFIFATQKEVSLIKYLSVVSIFNFFIKSLQNPKKLYSFMIAFKKFYFAKVNHKIVPTNNTIELSHFAVKNNWKSAGIGKKLLKQFENKANLNGFNFIFTRTHNMRLADYYTKHKNASTIKKIPLGSSQFLILKWKI